MRPGTRVRYWPGVREGAGKVGFALSSIIPASQNKYGTDVVRIEKEHGGTDYIATTHLEALPARFDREGDSQPLPTVNDAPDVQSAVIADIERRREVGISRYGTALQPNNGRNALLDAYEEALDLACYLKQRLIEESR